MAYRRWMEFSGAGLVSALVWVTVPKNEVSWVAPAQVSVGEDFTYEERPDLHEVENSAEEEAEFIFSSYPAVREEIVLTLE